MSGASDTNGASDRDGTPLPSPAPAPRWEIRPDPSDEELVALVTVLQVALRSGGAAATPAAGSGVPASRWAMAGRRAARRPWTGAGWGRLAAGRAG